MRTFILWLGIGCVAIAQTSRPSSVGISDEVVAKVNNTVILRSEVEAKAAGALAKAEGRDRTQLIRVYTARLVREAVAREAVESMQLRIPDRYVTETIEREKERLGGEAEFRNFLTEMGMEDEQAFRDRQSDELARQTFALAQAGAYSKSTQFRPDYWVEPSVVEMRRYYKQRLVDEFTQEDAAKTRVIYLPLSAFRDANGNPSEARTLEICETIRQQLATGADFGTLANRYGREYNASLGGDLGWIDAKSSYAKEIVDLALKGPVKQLSKPTRIGRGYALVWVDEQRPKNVLSFAEAKPIIYKTLRDRNVANARAAVEAKLLKEAFIWPRSVRDDLAALAGP